MKVIHYRNSRPPQGGRTILENYKLSAFCIEQSVGEGVLLCNTASGALVLLTPKEYQAILSGQPLAEDWAQSLTDLGFLPDVSQDEYAQVDQKRLESRSAGEQTVTSYTILPTSCCNARCFYCYEKGIPQKNMSMKTANDVADFILRNSSGQNVQLGWFGGEPTLAHPVITLICQRLREQKLVFQSSMISNGLLMDKSLIQTAHEEWNLKHIQITIDGTQEIYNRAKNYKGNLPNPYATVLSNVEVLLSNDIRVSIRINLGLHNFQDVSHLISELKERFPEKKNLTVYVHEIDNFYSDEDYTVLMDETCRLNAQLVQLGLQKQPELPSLRLHSCMADNDQSLLINPDGALGKCEHYVFDKLHGSIYSQETDLPLLAQWKEPVRYPQCGSCPLYACCLQLKWCNGGGFFCRDGLVRHKLTQIRQTMLDIYRHWKQKHTQFLEADVFRLAAPYEVRHSDNGSYALFRLRDRQIELPVNQTSLDILELLQHPHTIREVVAQLEDTYDTAGFAVGDIVEQYILSLLEDGLCIHTVSEKGV